MSNKLKGSSEKKSIQFGKLGSVTIEVYEDVDAEVFAKMENSYNGNGGPTYSDDCNLQGSNCGPAVTY